MVHLAALVVCAVAFIAVHAPAPAAHEPQYLDIHVKSALLSAFWNQDVSIEAHVLLPDSYYKEPGRRYPVFYWIQGFGGVGEVSVSDGLDWQRPMRALHEEFITVFLNGMFNGGHQEFADSANNGPWGAALTTEFIPVAEAHLRAIGTAQTRFVGGHSSGGWSALWLQTTYPDVFGAEWSLSPDPVDFRNFCGPDLTRSPPENFFTDPAGHPYVIDGQAMSEFVDQPGWVRAQFTSFEAVFSPRDASGAPKPLFDRRNGAIDADVAQYWDAHYDISRILRENWPALGPKLRGKLHVIVGTKDQFNLAPPVELLAAELRELGSDADIEFVPGANHFTIFDWHDGAIAEIVREASRMAVAAQLPR